MRNEKKKKNSGNSGQPKFTRTEKKPWSWILLSFTPLIIFTDLYLAEYSSKILWAAAVLTFSLAAILFQKKNSSEIKFTLPELFWLGYFFLGILALSWSKVPVLGFERLSYLSIGIAGYVVAKQTKFWRSSLYWHCFAIVALIVSLIGTMNFFFAGTALGFDWIPSAGKPSSTLGYRSYAAAYLVFSIPFLCWYVFSPHSEKRIFRLLGISSLVLSLSFLLQTRARSEWVGAIASFAIMGILVIAQKKFRNFSSLKYAVIPFLVIIIIAALPASREFYSTDKSDQQLANTEKKSISSTIQTMVNAALSGNFDRMQYWKTGNAMMFGKSVRGQYEGPLGMQNFLWGVGLGQFPTNAMLYNDTLFYHLYIELHNDWYQVLVELGPLGFIFFCGFMLSLLYYAFRIRTTGIGIACIGVITAWFFSTQFDFALPKVYCMLAIAGVAAILHHESTIPAIFSIRKFEALRSAPIVGGIWMLYITSAQAITMYWDRQIYNSMMHQDQTLDIVYKKMSDKSSIFNYYNGHGKFLLSPILEELMVRAQQSYIQNPPANATALQSDIRINLVEWLAKDLLQWNPDNINYLGRIAGVYYEKKKFSDAMPYLDKILGLQPNNIGALTLKANSLVQLGKDQLAAEIIKKNIQNDTKQKEYWKKNLPALYQQYVAD